MKNFKKEHFTVFVLLVCFLSLLNPISGIASVPSEPPGLSSDSFVDEYRENVAANKTPESNPAIALLSGFSRLWTPGATWDTGIKVEAGVLDANIQKSIAIAAGRQPEAILMAYLDDRRNQSYSIIEGLGPWADDYRAKAGARTTIDGIAPDATVKKYSDQGNGAGDEQSSLGNMVRLVNTLRGKYSSTNPAKSFYQYPRPFRQSEQAIILPELLPAKSATPETDGGFPSGHTNAAYLAALALAYSAPQRYQELLVRASELGHNRIVAGMHSALDVMGGRVMGTALAAAILSDPEHAALKQNAVREGRTLIPNPAAADRFADYAVNKKNYSARLTYGFLPIGASDQPMRVPKGAEVLLETRLPYLDKSQRRMVLFTTGLPSGYPLLDDSEGWGRLNLFAAADGYGAFLQDLTVTMDAAQGGFHARDSWRNDIAGPGMLIKAGSGTLVLTGTNSYSGGTRLDGGCLEGDSSTAFGSGDLQVNGGLLINRASDGLIIGGGYIQSAGGALRLYLGKGERVPLAIKGAAKLDGKLIVSFAAEEIPSGEMTLMTCASRRGKFSNVTFQGLPDGYELKVTYRSNEVRVRVIPPQ